MIEIKFSEQISPNCENKGWYIVYGLKEEDRPRVNGSQQYLNEEIHKWLLDRNISYMLVREYDHYKNKIYKLHARKPQYL